MKEMSRGIFKYVYVRVILWIQSTVARFATKLSVLYLTLQESITTQMHTLRMGENAEEQ